MHKARTIVAAKAHKIPMVKQAQTMVASKNHSQLFVGKRNIVQHRADSESPMAT
jgi:hypothetical protein